MSRTLGTLCSKLWACAVMSSARSKKIGGRATRKGARDEPRAFPVPPTFSDRVMEAAHGDWLPIGNVVYSAFLIRMQGVPHPHLIVGPAPPPHPGTPGSGSTEMGREVGRWQSVGSLVQHPHVENTATHPIPLSSGLHTLRSRSMPTNADAKGRYRQRRALATGPDADARR
ncbi:hypothetical protein BJV77DRAFT_965922 [Russula vinacea]|nr:hypothetical protein BJV77DRAFT_965922 [Russula vinacea]